MDASAAFARGLYGRVEDVQAWFPGTHGQFAARDRDWLERNFPLLKSDTPRGIGHHPGRDGNVWVRWSDGCWLVCHVCLPDWSRDRTIPAWAVASILDRDFRTVPCLADAVTDVLEGAGMRGAWCSRRRMACDPSWDDGALAAVVELFDAALAPPRHLGWYPLPAARLDRAGWIALQAMLVAMRDSDVPAPCAVWALEAPWASPPASIPPATYVFEGKVADAEAVLPARVLHPASRGVELRTFIHDLSSTHRLIRSVASRLGAADRSTRSFSAVVAPEVPLTLVDPADLAPTEWHSWAGGMAAPPRSMDDVAATVDELVARVRGGDLRALGPMLALASHWAGRTAEPGRVERRLDGWMTAAIGGG